MFKKIDEQDQTTKEKTFNEMEIELKKEIHVDIDAKKTRNLIYKSYLKEQTEKLKQFKTITKN